ncbi:hypothetical protein [Streptomyces sp. Je 1-369]|uniref:hypothetical protein n=1 Tax=Streptomyces sp. Je 1-369 TaxID=2966192 RepID=UPI0022857CD0|nr:hypothetical protein [Streptomyces sp. Je 1-369]WAL97846.1 hypothetical protein NOO62_27160 [Streptomyces sp. Je 1-369]
MRLNRRHTLLRTAAVSTLVGGALLLSAAGAFADSPAPRPTASKPHAKGEVHEVTLGNGATAKIRNRGGAYAAMISLEGKEIATLSATRPTVTQGGVTYELHPSNGHIGIAYLDGKDRADGDRTVAPKGGVKAGAEGVRDAGDPAFLVAGGGMAAAGAAGLGFAMLRRGRSDG